MNPLRPIVPGAMQRAEGAVSITGAGGPGGTVLRDLGQQGCLRACFPRRHGGPLEIVIVNTAGGIADGDRLRIDAHADRGADMVLTTPAAERVYRARAASEVARVDVMMRVESGARLAWLPQETILFDASALRRTTRIEMDASATFLGIEALVFGRAAHGETLRTLRLNDTLTLHRAGTRVLHDAIRMHGSVDHLLARTVSAGGMRAVATLVFAAPDAPSCCDAVRDVLATVPATAAASAWNGILVARFLAASAADLRASLIAALAVLRPDASLPRVWGS